MEFVLVFLIVCVVGANSRELFESVKVLFDNAWDAFKTFIKRPRRNSKVDEYGNGIKQKAKAPETVDAEVSVTKTKDKTTNEKSTVPPDMLYYFQRTKHKQRLLLPIIPTPDWRSQDDWYDNQDSNRFMLRTEEFSGNGINKAVSTFALNTNPGDETTSRKLEEYDEYVGVMMFI